MYQLDQLRVEPEIRWIRYGAFGREEGGLIIGTKGFTISIMKFILHKAKKQEGKQGRGDERRGKMMGQFLVHI